MSKQKEYDKEQSLISYWDNKFKNAIIAKSEYTKKWQRYYDAYYGEYFKNESLPDYKSNYVSNYIFSIIETIRPIMLDNNPKFQSIPRQPEGLEFADDLAEAFNFEWSRENMTEKLSRELVNALVTGNAIFFLPWNPDQKQVNAVAVNPFNFFPDPMATNMDDGEYYIYATYKNEGQLKKLFPDKADKLIGSAVTYSELVGNTDAERANINNQILVIEVWARDYSEDIIEDNGIKKAVSKYPNGRVITMCPENGVILQDKPNPYKDKKFPFVLIKDYDIPNKFWGLGEVEQLLSPQTHMNELSNAIIDNAKATANMPWIIDKNSGIGVGKITNRPGLVIRKNPGAEVRRDQPPALPAYIQNTVFEFKKDMEQISGIFDTLKGNSETGVYTAQGILALQEAGQARIRLKVKLLEQALGRLGSMWYERMRQFWKEEKWILLTRQDGSYDFKKFRNQLLSQNYDIEVKAGSTMNVNRGAMLDLMIRLAQTQMSDGQTLVDREAVVHYLPEEVKSALLKRTKEQQTTMDAMQKQIDELSQLMQQSDNQIVSAIQDVVPTVESVKKQILQLQGEYAKMMEENRIKEREQKLRDEAYNEGYKDAENISGMGTDPTAFTSMSQSDEVLSAMTATNEQQLQELAQKYPEIFNVVDNI